MMKELPLVEWQWLCKFVISEYDDSLTNRVNPPEDIFADLSGTNDSIFRQLLDRTGFNPSGRIVVVPDALGLGGWSRDNLKTICL